jgi:hypothetical protein
LRVAPHTASSRASGAAHTAATSLPSRLATITAPPAASTIAAAPPSTQARRRKVMRSVMASSSAATLGQRCVGSTASPRSSNGHSQAGTSRFELAAPSRRFPAITAARSSSALSPSNGAGPPSAIHSATQNANWSLRASTSPPSHCSGAMYFGVPTTAPSTLRLCPGSVVCAASTRRPLSARPKSLTRGRPSLPMSTFSGLKSRCTSPASCAACSPRPPAMNIVTISRQPRSPSASQPLSVAPSTSSIAMNTCSPARPTSYTVTAFGCASLAIAWASRCNLTRASTPAPPPRSTLIATLRSSSGSNAHSTTPMPPAPSAPSTTNRPIVPPGAIAIAPLDDGSVTPARDASCVGTVTSSLDMRRAYSPSQAIWRARCARLSTTSP